MKKNILLRALLLLLSAVLLFSLVSCGSSNKDASANAEGGYKSDVSDSPTAENDLAERKIIHKVSMTMETRDFDGLITKLESAIQSHSAYTENASQNASSNRRRATYVIRVPASNLDVFLESISDIGTVINGSKSSEDVTLAYVDTESRIKALKVEEESLIAMMEKTNNLNDLLQIRNRLTEVRYQLDSYESQLKKYDNLIDYSTVTIYVNEVERVTDANAGVWNQIGTKFMNNVYAIGDACVAFFIWFVGGIPVFIVLGAIGGVVAFFVIRQNRKARLRMQERKAKAEAKKIDEAK